MPRPEPEPPRFPDWFDGNDKSQEYELTAARLKDQSPNRIKRYTRERIDAEHGRQKHKRPPDDELFAGLDWDSCGEPFRPEGDYTMSIDVRQAISELYDEFPRARVVATLEWLAGNKSIEQIARDYGRRKCHVRDDMLEVRERLAVLLRDYRP